GEALRDLDVVDAQDPRRHVAQRNGMVGVDDVDEIAARPVAQRDDGHDDGRVDRAQQKARVDELVREQRAAGIREARLRLDRAGLDVDLVVERQELAVVELVRAPAVPRGHRELGAGRQALLHVGHALLRDGELDVDRRYLRDRRYTGRIARRNVIADVDRTQADATGDRGNDARPRQVEPCAVFVRAVDADGAGELLHQ